MPILPRGLGNELIERIRRHFQTELGGGPVKDRPAGFIERVVQRLTRDKGESHGRTRRPPPSGVADVMGRIQEAGARRVLLMAHYAAAHGHGPSWRYLGAYAYRWRDKDDPSVPLVYCWCAIHHAPGGDGVEAFKLRRFLDLQVTDLPWSPHHEVEF